MTLVERKVDGSPREQRKVRGIVRIALFHLYLPLVLLRPLRGNPREPKTRSASEISKTNEWCSDERIWLLDAESRLKGVVRRTYIVRIEV